MNSMTYKNSGVDIKKAGDLIKHIKPFAKMTHRPGVLQGLGGFGALFHVDFHKYKDPVLVSSTDGVGTKLRIATMAKKHDTIGIDLVAMSVNDLLAMGAEPLFFLDYFATSTLDLKIAKDVLKSIADGCIQAGCALIGGETAEMPSVFRKGEYELAGFAVGIVEKNKITDGADIGLNDVLIGLSSSGLHSNGYSLARKICFDKLNLGIKKPIKELNGKLGDVLLEPTRIYVKTVLELLKRFSIHGMVHITGGGLTENIPRILPKGCGVEIKKWSWDIPPIFKFLQKKGKITDKEMLKTFNCGVGYVLIAPENETDDIIHALKNLKQPATVIGKVTKRKGQPVVYT